MATKTGQVITYGPRRDGSEQFVILSDREDHPTPGIVPLRQCVLPTFPFAGPSPLQIHTNTLLAENRKWVYPAWEFRSTFFELHPATTTKAKGLLVYHSSIMLLSIAEKAMVENFCKLGWNIMVALPPDSLHRLNLPTQISPEGSRQGAAEMVAAEMDLFPRSPLDRTPAHPRSRPH